MKKQNKENFKSIQSSLEKNNKTLLICSSNAEIDYVHSIISEDINSINITRFYDREILPYDHFSTPDEMVKKRINEILKLKKSRLILSSLKNLFEFYPKYEFFDSLKTFNIGEKLIISDLKNILESLNYLKVDKITSLNEYSQRGGIIDINSSRYRNPIRIDFFDDFIESIREFDVKSQRSIIEIKSFKLNSGYEIPLNQEIVNSYKEKWREEFPNIDERTSDFFNKINKKNLPESYENYLPILINKPINFFNLVMAEKIFISNNSDITNYGRLITERFNDENNGSRELIPPQKLFFDPETYLKNVNIKKIKINNEALLGNEKTPAENIKSHKNLNHFHYDNSINIDDLVIHEDYGLGIFRGLKKLETSNKKQIPYLFSSGERPNQWIGTKKAEKEKIDQFKKSEKNEYLYIEYKDSEFLYVPIYSFNKVSKFHRKFDDVNLDSLSSTNWTKKKERAKTRIYDHASEILKIESERLKAISHSLRVSESDYSSFLDDFPFEDTADQMIVSKAIRKDLSLVKPMNRLLCGDVGFGKTEISMRAAFIASYSDKQTIILSPSTVLTDQHFHSFSQRFKNFPLTIARLSRNTTLKNKKKLYDDFNNKKIDILIGTHSLFNEKLLFQNVGLMIVDEEHKFGVKQKNLIKNKQLSTHILYMSATPIPKTMNMAFSGLKDFSFLTTPPSKRLSIKTFLEVDNKTIIKESLTREFNRQGCSFFIENDIKKMDKLKKMLDELVPDQKIDIVHAGLNKKIIDNRLGDFRNKKINILICTTIVEMGLDIPEANTIIINNAQNFGLSQLHQLRGRIGRSSRQGYCYALIPSTNINNNAKSRLLSFVNNSHLGSGFNIADEDLEIRGAGEILGIKQSGHIDDIGMSLYMSMLKTALKNNYLETKSSCEIKLSITNLIPEEYLPSPIERLKIYKSLSESNLKTLNEIKSDLLDKCGRHPQELKNLFKIRELSIKAEDLNIVKILQGTKTIKFELGENVSDKALQNIMKLYRNKFDRVRIEKKNAEFTINYINEDVLSLINEVIYEIS